MRSILQLLVLVPLVPLAGAFGVADAATTINVPADQPTIQAAVDAAANGDTILVKHGGFDAIDLSDGSTNTYANNVFTTTSGLP